MKTKTGVTIGLVLNLTILLFTAASPPLRAPWSPPSQLTHNLSNDLQPSISSSGDGIAFVSDETGSFELHIMDSNGNNPRQLTSDSNRGRELNPSISGDGTKVVFQSDVRGDEEIFVVNSDGSIPTCNPPSVVVMGTGCNLTNNRDDDVSPTVSEDGTKAAFVSNRDGVDVQEIYAMNVDGSSILCRGALLPACRLTLNSRINENPSMSGDGVLVAFDSNKGGDREIFTVKSDGTMPTCNSPAIPVPDTGCQLTNNFSNEDQYPSISGDGAKVVFVSAGPAIASIGKTPQSASPGPPLQTSSTTILIVSSNGTGLKALTSTSADNRDAFISGNGRLVAFVSDSDGDKEVITVNSDGTMTTQVTVNTAIDFSPRLNYGGDILVFVSDLDGDFEIFSASITTVDVAVTQIVTPRTIGYNLIASNPLEVGVTVANQGTSAETAVVEFSVQGGPVLSSQSVILAPGNSQVLTFWLNPQPMVAGTYTLAARAVPLAGETDTSDNTLNGGPITVRRPGDVDGDGDVDIVDAATLAFAFGTSCGSAGYVAGADLDNDCDIDIVDAASLAFYYGTAG